MLNLKMFVEIVSKLFNFVVDWILAQFDIYMEFFVYFPTLLIPH